MGQVLVLELVSPVFMGIYNTLYFKSNIIKYIYIIVFSDKIYIKYVDRYS